MKLFVAFPHIVKGFWGTDISTAMSLLHAGDALESVSAVYLMLSEPCHQHLGLHCLWVLPVLLSSGKLCAGSGSSKGCRP